METLESQTTSGSSARERSLSSSVQAWGIAAFTVMGTLFVIPTAGEVPMVQTLMSSGVGA